MCLVSARTHGANEQMSVAAWSSFRDGDARYLLEVNNNTCEAVLEMEMDSHGGLEVTIRQTESKKKTTQQLRETDP